MPVYAFVPCKLLWGFMKLVYLGGSQLYLQQCGYSGFPYHCMLL